MRQKWCFTACDNWQSANVHPSVYAKSRPNDPNMSRTSRIHNTLGNVSFKQGESRHENRCFRCISKSSVIYRLKRDKRYRHQDVRPRSKPDSILQNPSVVSKREFTRWHVQKPKHQHAVTTFVDNQPSELMVATSIWANMTALNRVHLATGMRPSELCRIRPCDIDRTGEVWVYRPKNHKTANRGKIKAVPILGDARDAITDYLNRSPEAFCFSPAESVAYWLAEKRSARKSKVQPSQQSRALENPRKIPGDHYTPHSYRQSIQRAAKRAGVEQWHPYQMRHLAITSVRDALGIEAAQAFAGHSNISMTEHYAKQTEAKAIEASKAAPRL